MAFDTNLILRALTTALTADATQDVGVDLGKTSIKGLAAVVTVPSVGTYAADSLTVKIQECTLSATNSTYWRDLVTFPLIQAAGNYSRQFSTQLRYIRAHCTVTGSVTTLITYGAVKINVGDEGNF